MILLMYKTFILVLKVPNKNKEKMDLAVFFFFFLEDNLLNFGLNKHHSLF